MFGKVRVMITDCPRFIVIFDNGKRTRLFPVVACVDPFAGIPFPADDPF